MTPQGRRDETPVRITMDNIIDVVRWTGRDIWDLARLLKQAEDGGCRLYMSNNKTKILRGIYRSRN